ncbi:unnamed protein product, partial [Cuscuta campestris]
MVEQAEGLYYLKKGVKDKVCTVKEAKDLDIWHKRLGHPSYTTVNTFLHLPKITNIPDSPCD